MKCANWICPYDGVFAEDLSNWYCRFHTIRLRVALREAEDPQPLAPPLTSEDDLVE